MSNIFGKLTFRIELAFGSCPILYTFAHKMYDDYFVIMLDFDWHDMHPDQRHRRRETTHIRNIAMHASKSSTIDAKLILYVNLLLLFSFDPIVFHSNDERIEFR